MRNIFKTIFKSAETHQTVADGWFGDYNNWQAALRECKGYQDEMILEKCKNSLLKVKNGSAIYERDSVLFKEMQYNFPLREALQKIGTENKFKLNVLDFGGSLGSVYFQNKIFLSESLNLKWCIVEQKHFVDCGKKYFEDQQLKFFYTIEDCIKDDAPDVLLLSSVLQYLQDPYQWIDKFIQTGITYIILDRTAFVEKEDDLLTVQHVPETIYKASYPAWFFNKEKLLNRFNNHYSILSSFNSGYTDPIKINNRYDAYWEGFLLKKKMHK